MKAQVGMSRLFPHFFSEVRETHTLSDDRFNLENAYQTIICTLCSICMICTSIQVMYAYYFDSELPMLPSKINAKSKRQHLKKSLSSSHPIALTFGTQFRKSYKIYSVNSENISVMRGLPLR